MPVPVFVYRRILMATIKKESLFKHSLKQINRYLMYHRKHILILCLMAAFFVPIVSFAEDDWMVEERENPIYQSVCDILDEITNLKEMDDVVESVSVSYSGGELTIGGYPTEGAADILNTFNHYAIGVGICLLCCTFFLSISNMRDVGMSTLYEFVKKLIYFVIGLIIIRESQDICFMFANAGASLAGKIPHGAGEMSLAIAGVKDSILIKPDEGIIPGRGAIEKFTDGFGHGIQYLFGYWLPLLLPLLLSKISRLIIRVVVWGRAIEIAILAAFSPIAFGDMTGEHLGTGTGTRFLKNFAALCLSGAIIVASMTISGSVMTGLLEKNVTTTEFGEIINTMLLVNTVLLTQAALVTRSQQIAKTICGVG